MAESPINVQDAVTLRDNERKLHALYVTAERQKWRDRIRQLVIDTVDIAAREGDLLPDEIRKLYVIRAELRVRLNLSDNNDQKIIEYIDDIITHKKNDGERLKFIESFEVEVSWLLKEDWERVKHETQPFWLWLCPKQKVDRSYKHVKKQLLFIERRKFLSFLFSIAILLGVLFSSAYAIGYAYQLTQSKEPKKEEVSKEIKEEQTPKCNAIAPTSQPVTVNEPALPIQVTVAPVIINELSNDDGVTTSKNFSKGSSRGRYCKK